MNLKRPTSSRTGKALRELDWALEKDIPTPVTSLAQTMLM